MKNDANNMSRQDVYSHITSQIVASLEQDVRPWVKPWNAEHAAGRITRPLRFNGQPYSGINILSLWMSATAQGFAAPIWMTFRQAIELNAHVHVMHQKEPDENDLRISKRTWPSRSVSLGDEKKAQDRCGLQKLCRRFR